MTLDRFLRTEPDWTEQRLADLTGYSQPHINKLRNDRCEASLGLALQIEGLTSGKVRADQIPLSRDNKKRLREMRERAALSAAAAEGSAA